MTAPDAAALSLYDTMSAQKRPFVPLSPGRCGVYCCGPTVYDFSHVGHALAAIVPDVLVRFLRQQGLEVTYVRNITDVDDKIIARAHEQNVPPGELADRYAHAYREDMQSLGVRPPDVEPTVRGHIPEIVALIEQLLERGMAYVVEGDVYYRVARFPAYGKLSKRRLDELQAGARVSVDERKDDPLDFALWKAGKPGEPTWPSPWGPGRPGWHIECSAMSTRHLGVEFDVHVGGRDLIFPHHENEIAQSQGAHGEHSFARYWVHNGFVNFGGEKMSKSLGNFFTIREVTALYHPEVLRFFLLGVHYRSPINFEVEVRCPRCRAVLDEAAQGALRCESCGHASTRDELRARVRFPGLEEADERLAYVYETIASARDRLGQTAPTGTGPLPQSVAQMLARFVDAMRDDLNTAAAIAALSEPLAEINRLVAARAGADPGSRARTIERFLGDFGEVAGILGVFERDPVAFLRERRDLKAARIGLDIARVDELVRERTAARAARDFSRADALRRELAALGVSLRDGVAGSTWTL